MLFPTTTALYASLFALLFLGLSAWVVTGRARFRIHHGDGGEDGLQRRIRAHGNFAEYVPLILLLAALVEGGGGTGSGKIHMLLLPLLAARLCHPVGMLAPVGSMRQFVLRGLSMIVTWVVMLAATVMLLMRVL